jgi:hypothetical protein
MSVGGWLGHVRAVIGRAVATTGRLAWSKLAVSVFMALLIAFFTAWYAADVNWPYSLPLVLVAVLSAALLTLALFFVGSLLAVPYGMHVEQARAAEAAAQACAAETARLTAELATARASLDERAQRREIHNTLGRFLAEGDALAARIQGARAGPLRDEVRDWLDQLSTFVREALVS